MPGRHDTNSQPETRNDLKNAKIHCVYEIFRSDPDAFKAATSDYLVSQKKMLGV